MQLERHFLTRGDGLYVSTREPQGFYSMIQWDATSKVIYSPEPSYIYTDAPLFRRFLQETTRRVIR